VRRAKHEGVSGIAPKMAQGVRAQRRITVSGGGSSTAGSEAGDGRGEGKNGMDGSDAVCEWATIGPELGKLSTAQLEVRIGLLAPVDLIPSHVRESEPGAPSTQILTRGNGSPAPDD
jgi:hypothetical protein